MEIWECIYPLKKGRKKGKEREGRRGSESEHDREKRRGTREICTQVTAKKRRRIDSVGNSHFLTFRLTLSRMGSGKTGRIIVLSLAIFA